MMWPWFERRHLYRRRAESSGLPLLVLAIWKIEAVTRSATNIPWDGCRARDHNSFS